MADEEGGLWLVADEPLRLSHNEADKDVTAVQFEVDAFGQLGITPVSGEPIYLGAGLEVDGDAELMADLLVDGDTHLIGNLGIGAAVSSAVRILIAAGSASLAPLGFSPGTLLTFPVDGRMEYDGSAYYATVGVDRQKILREPGSTGITTLGTVTTGVWSGTVIGPTKGGTGQTTVAVGDLLYGSAANVWSKLTGNVSATRKFLAQTGDGAASAAPVWVQPAFTDVTSTLAYAQLPTGSSSWDTGAATTITITRSLTVSGTLTGTLTGNASTATILAATRTIWGQNFNGSANVTGALSGATTGDFSGAVTTAQITATGDLLFGGAGGLYDVGKSGATTRPRDGFFSRDFTIGRNLTFTVVAALINGAGGSLDISADTGTTYIHVLPTVTQFVDMDIAVSLGHKFGFGSGATFQGMKSSGSGSSTDIYVAGIAAIGLQTTGGKTILYANHTTSNSPQMTAGFTSYGFGVYLDDTAAGNSTQAFVLEQDSHAHGMTAITATDTIMFIRNLSGGTSSGGVEIVGLSHATRALGLTAYGTNDDTTHTTSGVPYAYVNAAKKSGTGVTAAGAGANLFGIRNNGTPVYLFDADGIMWSFGSVTSQYGPNAVVGGTMAVTGTTTLATSLTGILRADAGVVSVSAGVGTRSILDHYADANNSGTGETDLYSDTLGAGRLAANGEKVTAQYGVLLTGAATATQQVKVYFGGTLVFDSGALAIGAATTDTMDLCVTIIRVSSSVVRVVVSATSNFAALNATATYTEITGLTLANTQILKITGTAGGVGGGSNQITAKEGYGEWLPAAA